MQHCHNLFNLLVYNTFFTMNNDNILDTSPEVKLTRM